MDNGFCIFDDFGRMEAQVPFASKTSNTEGLDVKSIAEQEERLLVELMEKFFTAYEALKDKAVELSRGEDKKESGRQIRMLIEEVNELIERYPLP